MKTSTLLSLLFFLAATMTLRAQDPGTEQDAEAAREKILKASDELDNIQANSEASQQAVTGMKADVVKLQADVTSLQSDNAALKQQVADLQAALDKSEAAQAKERQVLLDSVAEMIAAAKKSGAKASIKKKETAPSETPPIAASKPADADAGAAPAAGTASGDGTEADNSAANPAPVKTQKGYYHVVASGETLTLICNAYREEGVNVSVADIQNANGLTDKSILKVGQKLFIPKPGT